jgi:hypothetical protein
MYIATLKRIGVEELKMLLPKAVLVNGKKCYRVHPKGQQGM